MRKSNLLQKWAEDWQIQFNLIKCDFLRMINRKCPIVASHTIGECIIRDLSHIKYLGVTIDSQLSWKEHIKATTYKEGQYCQGIFASEHILLSNQCQLNCYKSLVKPILEYAAVVWASHTLSAMTSIEKIQRYATRFICNNSSRYSSVTDMLQSLSLPTSN